MPLSRFGSRIVGLARNGQFGSRGHSGVSQAGTPAMPAAAMGQNTAASQLVTAQVMAGVRRVFGGVSRSKPKRRKARASASAPRKRRKSGGKRKPARLVKGSAAAKRYMASIRRKRRK